MDPEVVTRIDAHRARRIGEILISDPGDGFDSDPAVLVDIEKLDGKQLLEQVKAKRAKFATAPFDPQGDRVKFYPGGVTIWSGFSGTGKTTLLRQFVCHTLARGSSVFLASLEEDPQEVIIDLTATAAGAENPNAHQVQWFIDAYAKRFRLWGKIQVSRHMELLATIRQAAAAGIKHAVIDSLMCLDVPNNDNEAQRQFAIRVSTTTKATGIHLHLVAHPRKPIGRDQEPDLHEVAGSREITGMADNVLFVRRSQSKQHYSENAEITPMSVMVLKQRKNRGRLGTIGGWFHRDKCQFLLDQFSEPIRYLPDHAYESKSSMEEF